jgi:peptide deformylase
MTQILKIAKRDQVILSQIACPVVEINHDSTQILIDSLICTAQQANGVGIAAPQVYQSQRLFILASRPNLRYPQAPLMEPIAIINPCILDRSTEMVKDWEGCLSVEGVRGLVPRHRAIAVAYYDRWGQLQKQEFTDFVARIFQHELDHLNGILFVDRVESPDNLYTEAAYQEIHSLTDS